MAHGGYDNNKRKWGNRKPKSKAGLNVEKKYNNNNNNNNNKHKPKSVSIKNQIRSVERMLRKDLPPEVKEAQEKKLQDLKKQQDAINLSALKHKLSMRDRKIKFFERRKIERRLRRLEKMQRASSDPSQDIEIAGQLSRLKEDLEYVRFFPKDERYVALFMGGDDTEIADRRNSFRKQIKDNIVAAAASGKDMEETGSEDDGLLDLSGDDFFLKGSSSDEDADDEWTDRSAKEQASSASGKAASGMSSDEKNQRQVSARALMPPPQPSSKSYSGPAHPKSRFAASSSKRPPLHRGAMSTSSYTSTSTSEPSFINGESSFRNGEPSFRNVEPPFRRGEPSFRNGGSSDSRAGQSSNLSSNSDAHKPRRKRRPKKKKQ